MSESKVAGAWMPESTNDRSLSCLTGPHTGCGTCYSASGSEPKRFDAPRIYPLLYLPTPHPRTMSDGKKRTGGRRRNQRARGKSRGVMVFERRNYLLLLLGVALVVVGYVIMRMENEVDGFISLYIAPLLILGGYLEIIYAIMWRPKKEQSVEVAQ